MPINKLVHNYKRTVVTHNLEVPSESSGLNGQGGKKITII